MILFSLKDITNPSTKEENIAAYDDGKTEIRILTSLEEVYYYACDVIEGRWAEAEPFIMKDAYRAYCYRDYFNLK